MRRTKAELVDELQRLRERLTAVERVAANRTTTPEPRVRDDDLAARLDQVERIARLGRWEWDLEKGELIWSPGLYRIFGLDPRKPAPDLEALFTLMHAEDRRRARAAVNRVLADPDMGISLAHRIVTPDGAVRHIHMRGEVERMPGSSSRRLVGTGQDITDQTLAEAALTESERRFALFMDHLPAAAMIKSPGGRLLFANTYLRETFSESRTPTRGPRHAQGLVDRRPDDDRRALKEGRHVREEQVTDVAGRPRWLHTVKFAIPQDEAPPLLGCLSWDITDQREAAAALHESEELYRSLWDNAPVGLWLEDCSGALRYLERLQARGVTDLDAHFKTHPEDLHRCADLIEVVSVNQAAVEMNGVSSASDLVGPLGRLLGDDDLPVLSDILKAVAEGRRSLEFENVIVGGDGRTRTLAMRFFTPPEYRRTWQVTLVAATDVTERERLWRILSLRTRELTALRDIADAVGREAEIEGVLDVALRGLEATVDPVSVVIELEAAVGGPRRRVASGGGSVDDIARLDKLCARVVERGAPVFDLVQGGSPVSYAAMPLRVGDRRLGALALATRGDDAPETRESFLSILALGIALAVVNRERDGRGD